MKPHGPPHLFLRFFRWFCHPSLKDPVEGDLMELYLERRKQFGRRSADLKFALDVLLLFRPGIVKFPNFHHPNTAMMYKSYFKIGWRNLVRDKLYSLIKILGLSIGLTVCMLIFLYSKDEISYDQFHQNKGRIFRIIQHWDFGPEQKQTIGVTNGVLGEAFASQVPEVAEYVRVNGIDVWVKKGSDIVHESPLAVDSNFFSVFTFTLAEGDPRTALHDLHSIILSREVARRYFGTDDAMGKTMQIRINDDLWDFTVTGITDRSPQNSTIKIDMLVPFGLYARYINNNKGWLGGSMNTFLLLNPEADVSAAERKMQDIFDRETRDQLAKVKEEQGFSVKIRLGLQRLTDIHLSRNPGPDNGMADGSDPAYSFVLTCIAIFILIIACINFVNLAIAQSMKRAREIGVRKVIGSTRKQLVRLFLTESFLVSSVSFCIALLLTMGIIPTFNSLANKELDFSYLVDGYLIGGFLSLLIITSFTAGFYPALVLSSFQPVQVLYGRYKTKGRNLLTKGLIVVQFTLAMFLIIGTIAINSQLNFLFHANLGYDSQNLVRVEIPIRNTSESLPSLFKNELAGRPDIVSVAARNGGRSISGVRADGKMIEIENVKIDDRFLSTFRIPIVSGRNFSPDHPSDSLHSVIVNETFVRAAGWKTEDAVGRTVQFMDEAKREATVVGVIKDYHFLSLKEDIKPELLSMNPSFNFGEIWIRIDGVDVPGTLSRIRSTFVKLVPLFPYSYEFMNDINARNYESETKWRQIITIASALFMFISCIGLFGLVGLSVEHRTKEIGIRKILGAAISTIVGLISKEFALLVGVAFVVATPAAWYAISRWLELFAYRIDPGWWMFASGGILVVAIALAVVCMQAIKAAVASPVNSLKTE